MNEKNLELRNKQRREWTQQLIWEFELICEHYRIPLKRPLIRIEESKSFWGQFSPSIRTLSLNRALIEQYRWDDVIEVLKHEMAHQIVLEWFQENDCSHGASFQKACTMIHVAPWAARACGDIKESLKSDPQSDQSTPENLLLRRAEKLLALSQSDNEHESMLAMERLSELSKRYNIERLLAEKKQNFSYIQINHQKKKIPQHQSLIANILQKHFFVDIVFSSEYHAASFETYKTMEILGTRENVEMAEYVYYYLWNQLPRMWQMTKSKEHRGQQAKRAYFLGILESFEEKLFLKSKGTSATPHKTMTKTQTLSEVKTEKLLDIERQELAAFVRKRHPMLRTRKWQANHDELDSYQKGRQDGRSLELNPGLKRNGSQRTLLHLPSNRL